MTIGELVYHVFVTLLYTVYTNLYYGYTGGQTTIKLLFVAFLGL